MKIIKLTKQKHALVDDDLFEYLNQWKWHVSTNGYAVHTTSRKIGKQKVIFMHRLISKTPNGFDTDHINRNKLDNRLVNLRIVTRQINAFNVSPQKNNKSGITGVTWVTRDKKWMARIQIKTLGLFKKKSLAILTRRTAERIYL